MSRLTASLAAVLLVLASACAQEASAQERIANAATATTGALTAQFSMEVSMAGGPQPMMVTATGGMDFANQRSTMTMDLGAMAAQAGMGKMKLITDGTIIYMRMPNAKQMGIPTPWLKMDLEAMEGMQGLGDLQQLSNDPADSMQMLRGVSENITEVGEEEVRGVATTHYRATLDLDKAVEAVPEDAQAYIRQQLELLGTSTLPVEVWIDDEGRLRRQTVEMDLSTVAGQAGGGAAAGTMNTTFELFDFGTPVDVKPPPAGKVTDMAEMGMGS